MSVGILYGNFKWGIIKINNIFVFLFLARLYESTGRAIAVTTASASTSALALLKTLKVFG